MTVKTAFVLAVILIALVALVVIAIKVRGRRRERERTKEAELREALAQEDAAGLLEYIAGRQEIREVSRRDAQAYRAAPKEKRHEILNSTLDRLRSH